MRRAMENGYATSCRQRFSFWNFFPTCVNYLTDRNPETRSNHER